MTAGLGAVPDGARNRLQRRAIRLEYATIAWNAPGKRQRAARLGDEDRDKMQIWTIPRR